MQMTGNTILITGGGSGIGLAMAEEFLKLGNQVIVAGRSPQKLRAAEQKGLKTITVDLTDMKSLESMAQRVGREYPNLNVVIHNAGVMKNENLIKGPSFHVQQETLMTNLLGPMRLTDLMLPHLLNQKSATIMTVTSGLAYLPLALTPTYSATKAAIHSYTESLRFQLKDTSVEVLELVPPYVQTNLMGERQAKDPNAMPLQEFIDEVFAILKDTPASGEILVKRVHPLRFSAHMGQDNYQAFFGKFNETMKAARATEF